MSTYLSMRDEDLTALNARLAALHSYGEVLLAGVAVEDLRRLVAEVRARRAAMTLREDVPPSYDDQPPLACCGYHDDPSTGVLGADVTRQATSTAQAPQCARCGRPLAWGETCRVVEDEMMCQDCAEVYRR